MRILFSLLITIASFLILFQQRCDAFLSLSKSKAINKNKLNTFSTYQLKAKSSGGHIKRCTCATCRGGKPPADATSLSTFQLKLSSTDTEIVSTTTVVGNEKPVPKVPSNAWRWPDSWPFPPDSMDLVENPKPLSSDSNTLGIMSQDSQKKYREHLSTLSTTPSPSLITSSTLEVGTSGHWLLNDNESKKFEIDSQNMQNTKIPFDSNVFDRIVVTSKVEGFFNPRDTFREIWRVLKPGGQCFVCFSGRNNVEKPVKLWTTMNDEQKIWIVGSYFHYSAGDGWSGIEAYDLLGSTGKGEMVFDLNNAPQDTAFVVQADKLKFKSPKDDDFVLIDYIQNNLLGAKFMEEDDKAFIGRRIATEYERAKTEAEKIGIINKIPKLSQIYEIIRDVKEVIIPSPVKAMLASFLFDDWENTQEQRLALRKGLGLDPPDEFWNSLSSATSLMTPREKIVLLSSVVPQFGKRDDAIQRLPAIINQVIEKLKSKLPNAELNSLQSFATSISISDYLYAESIPTEATVDRLIRYLSSLSEKQLTELITQSASALK